MAAHTNLGMSHFGLTLGIERHCGGISAGVKQLSRPCSTHDQAVLGSGFGVSTPLFVSFAELNIQAFGVGWLERVPAFYLAALCNTAKVEGPISGQLYNAIYVAVLGALPRSIETQTKSYFGQ